MKTVDSDNVLYLVQKRFREAGATGKAARVYKVEHRHDEIHGSDWWLVRVEINVPLSHLSDYYSLLNDLEEKLETEDELNCLIVPTIPEEQAAA